MHSWGDWPDESFDQVDEAAMFIGNWLRKWGRVPVRQTKEKYGTVRVYCGLGWDTFYSVFYPGYCYYRWPKPLVSLDLFLCYTLRLTRVLLAISRPIHILLYRWRYAKAVKKWPHLREEILCCADFPEPLQGL